MKKRLLSLSLCVAMLFTMLPTFVFSTFAATNAVRTTVLDLGSTFLSYVDNTGSTVTANPSAQDITNSGEAR